MTGASRAEPDDVVELTAALGALASFQSQTQQTDGKASMLLAVQVGLGAVLATQVPQVVVGAGPGWTGLVARLAAAAYLLTFCVVGYLLVQVVRPRVGPIRPGDRFGLPVPAGPGSGGSVGAPGVRAPTQGAARCTEEAWRAAGTVAQIAARKVYYVGRAVGWTAAMVVLAIFWLVAASY